MTIEELLEKTAGNDGIASESTAKKILAALGGSSGGGGGAQREFQEETKKTSKSVVVFKKVLGAAGAGFESLSNGANGLVGGFNQLAHSTTGLNKVILQFTADLAARVFENVDTFRNLAEIGANTTQTVSDFRRIAGDAGIDMTRLAQALMSANTALAGFGGDAGTGARRFNTIMAELLQSDFRRQITGLGFSMADITEGFADYLDLQTSLGRSQSMSNSQLVAGSQEYLLRLDQLSRLTGMQRDQVKAELQAVADARELRLISNKEIEATMVRVKAAAPEMVNAVTGLLAKGFPEGGEQVGIFAVEGVKEAVTALRDGVPGASDMFIQALARNGEMIANMDESQKRLIATQLGVGNEFFNVAADSVKFRKFLGQSTEEIIKEQERRAKATEGAKQFDQASENLRSSFQKLMTPFQQMYDGFIGFIANGIEPLAKALNGLGTKFNDWYDGLSDGAKTFSSILITAATGVSAAFATIATVKTGKKVASYLTGVGGGGGKMPGMNILKSAGAGGGSVLSGAAKGISAFAAMGPKILMGAGIIAGVVAILGAGVGLGALAAGKGLQTLAEGLNSFQNVDGEKLKDIASATSQLSLAMASMGAGALKGGVSGFIGKIFGGGTENFAKNLNKTLDELDKSKIDVYATSLENLGNAMTNLRGGMTGTMTTTASATGDKLDQLNNTMEQILMAIADSNRYNRITSQATVETAENFG
jgi:hypothetical protein